MKTKLIYIIGLSIVILIAMGAIECYKASPILCALFYYDDPMHYLYVYGSGIGLGVVAAWVLYRFDVGFDRIGLSMLLMALAIYALMIVVPINHHGFGEQIAPVVDGRRYIFRIGFVSIEPVFFYLIALGWLIDYAHRGAMRWMSVNKILLTAMAFSAMIMITLHDMNNLMFIEIVLLAVMTRLNGFGKITIASIAAVSFMFAFMISSSEHVMNHLIQWWNALLGFGEPMHYDFTIQMSAMVIVGVLVIYGILLYAMIRTRISDTKNSIFLDTSIIIIAVDVVLNLSARVGLYPAMPSDLFLIDINPSLNVAFFVMLGMILMTQKSNRIGDA